MTVVERIVSLMEASGVNGLKLTTDLDLANGAVTDWKKGKANPSSGAIVKIANYFGVSTDYLLTGADYAAPALEPHERQLLDAFKKLSYEGQNVAINQVAALANMYPTGKDGI